MGRVLVGPMIVRENDPYEPSWTLVRAALFAPHESPRSQERQPVCEDCDGPCEVCDGNVERGRD